MEAQVDRKAFFEDSPILEDYSNIEAYVYDYNDKAKQLDIPGVDDKTHFGVMAQDLESKESTEGTVLEGDDGYLEINANQLAVTNAAAISELTREVKDLKETLRNKGVI